MININDVVYIRPDIALTVENERGRVISKKDNLYFVTNLNMPFYGTISTWLTEYEISLQPWV